MMLADDPATVATTFDQVYRERRAPLVRLATLILGSQAIAEEVVQEACVRLYDRFDTIDNPAGFLRTATVRLCATALTRHKMEHERLMRLSVTPPTPPADTGDDDAMRAAIAHLDADRRMVVVLRYYEDLTYDEIAAALDCPVGTVRSRLHRALDDLRKEVER